MPVVRIWKRDGGAEEPPRRNEPSTTGETQPSATEGIQPSATEGTQPSATESKAGETEVSGTETAAAQSKRTAEPTPGASGNPAAPGAEWDLEVRPQHAIRTARIVAAVLALIFIIAGVLLRNGSTGVNFRLADQLGLAVFGLLLGGAVLLLTRPRVRVGRRGVAVRNILGDTEFRWQDIRGISFADKKSWARLELVHDEYVPMMAIRTNDKLRAAGAMDRFRELGAKYTAANTN